MSRCSKQLISSCLVPKSQSCMPSISHLPELCKHARGIKYRYANLLWVAADRRSILLKGCCFYAYTRVLSPARYATSALETVQGCASQAHAESVTGKACAIFGGSKDIAMDWINCDQWETRQPVSLLVPLFSNERSVLIDAIIMS